MPTITTGTNGCMLNSPRRTYIASREFSGAFYKLVQNDDGSYSLNGVTGANAGNCPQGRVLRENGKKVYPGQYAGVAIYLVGVYDESSFLSGFINPNSPCFAVLNTDMPTYLTSILGEGGAADDDGLTNQGNAVYTRGDVIAGGQLVVSDLSGVGSTVGGDLDVVGNLDVSGAISFNVQVIPSAAPGATTTFNFATRPATFYKYTLTTGSTLTNNLVASGFLPANTVVYLEFINSSGANQTLTFSTGFNVTGTLGAVATGKARTIVLMCNGSSFSEISRTSGDVTPF